MNLVEQKIDGRPFLILFDGPVNQTWWTSDNFLLFVDNCFHYRSRSRYYIKCFPTQRMVELTTDDQRRFHRAWKAKDQAAGLRLLQELVTALGLEPSEREQAFIRATFEQGITGANFLGTWEKHPDWFLPLASNQQSVIISSPEGGQHADL